MHKVVFILPLGAVFGVFRRGNKPPVLLGVGKERSKNKNGELKASRKAYTEEKPPSIIVNGLATALLEIYHGGF